MEVQAISGNFSVYIPTTSNLSTTSQQVDLGALPHHRSTLIRILLTYKISESFLQGRGGGKTLQPLLSMMKITKPTQPKFRHRLVICASLPSPKA
jgi:hypothetical protein